MCAELGQAHGTTHLPLVHTCSMSPTLMMKVSAGGEGGRGAGGQGGRGTGGRLRQCPHARIAGHCHWSPQDAGALPLPPVTMMHCSQCARALAMGGTLTGPLQGFFQGRSDAITAQERQTESTSPGASQGITGCCHEHSHKAGCKAVTRQAARQAARQSQGRLQGRLQGSHKAGCKAGCMRKALQPEPASQPKPTSPLLLPPPPRPPPGTGSTSTHSPSTCACRPGTSSVASTVIMP
jgi:hypothetical protein